MKSDVNILKPKSCNRQRNQQGTYPSLLVLETPKASRLRERIVMGHDFEIGVWKNEELRSMDPALIYKNSQNKNFTTTVPSISIFLKIRPFLQEESFKNHVEAKQTKNWKSRASNMKGFVNFFWQNISVYNGFIWAQFLFHSLYAFRMPDYPLWCNNDILVLVSAKETNLTYFVDNSRISTKLFTEGSILWFIYSSLVSWFEH